MLTGHANGIVLRTTAESAHEATGAVSLTCVSFVALFELLMATASLSKLSGYFLEECDAAETVRVVGRTVYAQEAENESLYAMREIRQGLS